MKLSRFSLRELLMLLTIAALLMPHIYSRAFSASRVDLSYEVIREMVSGVAPEARILSGSGGREVTKLTCLVPIEDADSFFAELHKAIESKFSESGWRLVSRGSTTTNGESSGFNFTFQNGSSRCTVLGLLVDKKKGKDWLYDKDVEEVRFVVLSSHVR